MKWARLCLIIPARGLLIALTLLAVGLVAVVGYLTKAVDRYESSEPS